VLYTVCCLTLCMLYSVYYMVCTAVCIVCVCARY